MFIFICFSFSSELVSEAVAEPVAELVSSSFNVSKSVCIFSVSIFSVCIFFISFSTSLILASVISSNKESILSSFLVVCSWVICEGLSSKYTKPLKKRYNSNKLSLDFSRLFIVFVSKSSKIKVKYFFECTSGL